MGGGYSINWLSMAESLLFQITIMIPFISYFSSIFDPDVLQIYAFEKINMNPTDTNVSDKSRNVIFYQLLWQSRGNGRRKYHYLHEKFCPFPCRSILICFDRKGALRVYILALKIGIFYLPV